MLKIKQKHFKGFTLASGNPKYLPEMEELDVDRAVWMWQSLEEA